MAPARTPSMPVVVTTPQEAAREVAAEIAELVRARREAGRRAVLGLATGKTPLGVYEELARLHREDGLDLSNVVVFNLDEYLGLPPGDPRTFKSTMRAVLFDRIGLRESAAHIPSSALGAREVELHAELYETSIAAAGGIDLQLLGIGRNGHIGFNEPGSERESRTREVELARETREDAAAAFGGLERVPRRAITMGVATILAARRIRVLAFGEAKRDIVRRALGEPIGPACPATFLREHADVRLYADRASAS